MLLPRELEKIHNDPKETSDLIDQLPGIAERMKIDLESWRRSCLDDQKMIKD